MFNTHKNTQLTPKVGISGDSVHKKELYIHSESFVERKSEHRFYVRRKKKAFNVSLSKRNLTLNGTFWVVFENEAP